MPPRLSIIIPTYNRKSLLCLALSSALNQTVKDLEVIVIDDASSDETPEILKLYQSADPRVRYERNTQNRGLSYTQNRGLSYNRNRGVELAQGRFITILDDDDEMLPVWAEHMLRAVESLSTDSHLAIAQCRAAFIHQADGSMLDKVGSCTQFRPLRPRAVNESPGEYMLVNRAGMPQTTSYIWPKEIFHHVRFHSDVKNGDDTIFALWALNTTSHYTYVNEVLYAYRMHDRTQMSRSARDFNLINQKLDTLRTQIPRREYLIGKFYLVALPALVQRAISPQIIKIIITALKERAVPPRNAVKMLVRAGLPPNVTSKLRRLNNNLFRAAR